MKILKTSSFEKLDINPIKLDDIETIKMSDYSIDDIRKFNISPINADEFIVNSKTNDLKPGYIVKTVYYINSKHTPNVWIYFDDEHLKKIFVDSIYDITKNSKHSGALVRYNFTVYNNVSYLFLKNYFGFWPTHKTIGKFDVISIYRTNINLDIFKNKQDIIDFYMENKLYEL